MGDAVGVEPCSSQCDEVLSVGGECATVGLSSASWRYRGTGEPNFWESEALVHNLKVGELSSSFSHSECASNFTSECIVTDTCL